VALRGSLDVDASRQALERAADATAPLEILDGVLAAWRVHHHPAIAELVDAAAARALEREPSRQLAGNLAARHAQWMSIAAQRRPIDLAWLFTNFAPSRGELGMEHIAAIASWPDDPRVVVGLLALCRQKPLVTYRRMWTRIFAQIRARLALHALPILRELAAPDGDTRAGSAMTPITSFDMRLHTRLGSIAREQLAALPAPDAGLIARIASTLDVRRDRESKRTVEDLLREVWAAPRDDAPRHVLADWLTERGDLRGELIALQLARTGRDVASTRRERRLLAEHGRVWMGPLEPVIVSNALLAFDRGFVVRCEVAWRRLAALPHLMTHAAWSTVREYRIAAEGEQLCDAWLDHMIALGAKRV
jgi:uncharacterized protein (TIGR02996 family)